MNCSPKLPTRRDDCVRERLVGGDVRDVVQTGKGDLSDWIELMEAVEALCPVWPEADKSASGGVYRL